MKEQKNFKMQMGWCAVMSWVATLLLAYKVPATVEEWMILPFGAIIFTLIHFKMSLLIEDVEKDVKP
jgi:purine-cytosine permease-like protein